MLEWLCTQLVTLDGACTVMACVFSLALSMPISDTPQACESGVCRNPRSNTNQTNCATARVTVNGEDGECWCG